MKLKVGKIPYLNSVLFYHGLESNPETLARLEFVPMVPRRLSEAAAGERIDAGPLPLVTAFELSGSYEPLDDLCIATVDKSRSILLFSKEPVEKLDGATVGITDETSTSVRLLKVLFARHFGVTPKAYVPATEPSQAFLLIGDSALRHRGGYEGYPFTTDLGEVWREFTGLPFVFAVWMARRGLGEEQKAFLKSVVSSSLKDGWSRFDNAVGGVLGDVGMTPTEAREYLEGFHFRMGPAERESVARFKEMDERFRRGRPSGVAETPSPAEAAE